MSIKIKANTKGFDDFDVAKMTVELNCPKCQAPNTVTLGQVKREETVTCTGCSTAIKLHDKDKSTDKTISSVNSAMGDLKKTLDNLGR